MSDVIVVATNGLKNVYLSRRNALRQGKNREIAERVNDRVGIALRRGPLSDALL